MRVNLGAILSCLTSNRLLKVIAPHGKKKAWVVEAILDHSLQSPLIQTPQLLSKGSL